VWNSVDAAAVQQVTGPGRATVIGPIAHVANIITVSRDLKRATIMWRDYRGDAMMYRVVKRQ